MHILLIHQAFASINEAGGTRHYEMATYLAERGHQVTIITSPVSYLTGKTQRKKIKWIEKQEINSNIRIFRTYTYPALHKSFFHRIISFFSFMLSSFSAGLRVRDIDLVWGTSPPIFQGLTAWTLARLKKVPFVFEVRDLWPAFAIAVGVLKNPFLIRLSLWLEKFLYRHADVVVVNSPGYIEHVKEKGATRVKLIPNGVDPEMFDPLDSGVEFRKANGIGNQFFVVYAGAHGLSNDLEVVLHAAKLLSDEKDILIGFVGDGKEKRHIQELAASLDLKNVRFFPPVSKFEMKKVLAASDACIGILKPLELYKTTYPNKVFDYMAAGRPVVLAIDGEIRKVIDAANGGIAVEPGNAEALADAIRKLSNDREQARKMGINANSYVKLNFNRNNFSEAFLMLLEDVRRNNG